jgi:hypothetical protein
MTGLSKAGFEDSNYRFDFSTLVLESVGFPQPTDDIYDFYFKRLDTYTERFEKGGIDQLTFEMYLDLIIEKRKYSEAIKP